MENQKCSQALIFQQENQYLKFNPKLGLAEIVRLQQGFFLEYTEQRYRKT